MSSAKPQDQNPKWWRDLPENEYKVAAYSYMKAHNEALLSVAKILGTYPMNMDEGLINALAEHLEPQIKDGANYNDIANPTPLHATIYATRSYGIEKMKDAVTGLGWIEVIAQSLREKSAPVAQIVSAAETLPSGANLSTFTQAITEAFVYSLKSPQTHSSPPIVPTVVDIWVKNLIGKGIQEFLEPDAFVIGTAPLLGHQNSFLTRKYASEYSEELSDRRNSQTLRYRARSRLGLPEGVDVPNTEVILQKIHTNLLKRKENAASLLKTHLYLVDQARREGGQEPRFTVHLNDLLEAKGYQRRADGGFHPNTYREEWGRLATLAGCWLEVRRITEKNKRGKTEIYIDETPYWQIEARRRLEEGDALGIQPILLADPHAPIIKSVLLRPGLWWALSDVGDKYLNIPRGILALPTDGNGNAKERMAVQITVVLALRVRASQKAHAGTERGYSVGKLLETAGVVTRQEFDEMHAESAKRLREHLAGSPSDKTPQGAIHILAKLGAFMLSVKDEADFWASSRGWKDRFWSAQLSVWIPNLSIAKKKN